MLGLCSRNFGFYPRHNIDSVHTLAQHTNEKQAVKLESERASDCHNSVPSVGTARI